MRRDNWRGAENIGLTKMKPATQVLGITHKNLVII